MSLTDQQRRELNLALRHLGRAMKAIERAKVPPASDFVTLGYRLNVGIEHVYKASDAMIDGLLSIPTDGSE
jgi:hypothetical protein